MVKDNVPLTEKEIIEKKNFIKKLAPYRRFLKKLKKEIPEVMKNTGERRMENISFWMMEVADAHPSPTESEFREEFRTGEFFLRLMNIGFPRLKERLKEYRDDRQKKISCYIG